MSHFGLIICIIIFGLIPFGYLVVWTLYRKSVIFITAYTTFIAAMGQSAISYYIGEQGLIHLTWGLPLGLVWLVSVNSVAKRYIRRPIMDLNLKINELSKGNLNLKIDASTLAANNEIGEIAKSIDELISQLQKVSKDIHSCANDVSQMSGQLNDVATNLSDGASSQAASVEELSSSIEEMSANTSENASHARETESIALESSSDIQESLASMNHALEVISEISQKINVVGDIAFQTNILALNAAVEAARAGEQGKGFAVVASEVRKLAEHSKIASEAIIALSNKGLDVSQQAGAKLGKVTPKIDQTAKLVQQITTASIEQESGTAQINHAIQNLNEQTQANASTSENLVITSQRMNQQSTKLMNSIGFFQYNELEKLTISA
ncbi:MAG: methyl-accepting chemotaxis protein [Bacteroidota bacterium]|nr:methyl-accepting chemotaxis protein [Bacteroidota bacterium]